MDIFLQHSINALSLGSLYALIAIGYTMVYGIIRLINFAHGEIFMISAYFAFYLLGVFLLPWWLSFILAIVLTIFTGILVEKVAYKPLRNYPRVSVMISAIGVSFFLQNLGIVVFGGRPKAFPVPELFGKIVKLGFVQFVGVSAYIPVITILALLVLLHIIYKTKIGMAMRASSLDIEATSLMGISVNKVVSITFAIGSGLAAVGGIMWSMRYPQLMPVMGLIPGLKCFIAAVVGGIGKIKGAVVGGLVIGFGEIAIVALSPSLSGFRDAFAFVLLIAILMIKPTGIFGSNAIEKV